MVDFIHVFLHLFILSLFRVALLSFVLELQAAITETNPEKQAALEEERDADKRRMELQIQSQLFHLCWQSLAKCISDEHEGYMVCPDSFQKRTALLRPYVKMCVEADIKQIIKRRSQTK